MRIRILTLLLILPVFASGFGTQAGSRSGSGNPLELEKIIDLKKAGARKGLSRFLLGGSKESAIIPSSLCLMAIGDIAVTDTVNRSVIILSRSGKIKKTIRKFKKITLVSPVSSCTDGSGNLYISDSAHSVLLHYSSRYKFKAVLFSLPKGRITGISWLKDRFYCLDTVNHRVICLDRSGKTLFTFGSRGSSAGKFNYPTHICASYNYLYITDAMNFRIQVFDLKGKFIRSIGSHGRGGGNFSKPKGITADKNGFIFVADVMFDNIQVFNRKGEFLYFFGGPGQNPGEFWMPSSVSVGPNNRIWVADSYNSRLQIFKLNLEFLNEL